MSKIDTLKTEIESLNKEDFDALRHWLLEHDWEHWDARIAADSAAGKLDFLVKEALEAVSDGFAKPL